MSKLKIALHSKEEYQKAYDLKMESFRPDQQWAFRQCMEFLFDSSNKPTRALNLARKQLNILLGFDEDPEKDAKALKKAAVKTVYLLCEHTGENGPTARTPRRVWIDGQDDHLLDITVKRCVAFDNDMLIDVKLWEKKAVELPIWMNTDEFITSYGITLRWYLGFGGQLNWPESWYRKLTALDENTRFAVIKLLNQKAFRVEKRQDMRNRFEAWLNDMGELQKYDLSNVRNAYTDQEADRCSHHIYWSR